MLRAMHPSDLKSVVPQSAPAYAEFLFSGVAAMLFEGSAPDGWELLAPGKFGDVLFSAGIDCKPR